MFKAKRIHRWDEIVFLANLHAPGVKNPFREGTVRPMLDFNPDMWAGMMEALG